MKSDAKQDHNHSWYTAQRSHEYHTTLAPVQVQRDSKDRTRGTRSLHRPQTVQDVEERL